MIEGNFCTNSGQVIELYDCVLRKLLSQIISQCLRLASLPCMGHCQCQAVTHIPPRRTSLRENGLLSCSIHVSEQGFAEGRHSTVSGCGFLFACLFRRICGPSRELTRFFKMPKIGSCVRFHC